MANLPDSGQAASMDSLTVTREQFRAAKNKELEFLAQALGGVSGSYTIETVRPTEVILQGTPKLAAGAEPGADDESLRLANTAWVKKYAGNATDTEPGNPVDGQIWVDISSDPPILLVWDETNNEWIQIGGGTSTKSFEIANDDAALVGATTTEAINAALVSKGFIDEVADLAVSDQLEVIDTGNANANANVVPGRYLYDGTTWFTRQEIYLHLTGGRMTGAVTSEQRTITAGAFDLATGNFWECGAIAIPNPTNVVVGQSGAIVMSAKPTSWGNLFKFPEGTAPDVTAFPAIVPYYVYSTSQILVGTPQEDFR